MATDAPLLTIVVPAYNEERRLPPTLDTIVAYVERQSYPIEILVADDGSADQTVALAQQRSKVVVLTCPHRGKGATVRSGVFAAKGHYVLLCDADLATPIEEWDKLRHYLDLGYEVVIGSREGLGSRRIGEPWYRHVMGRVFNLIVRLVAVGNFQDTQCGFKALRRDVALDLFRRVRLYGDDAKEISGPAVTAYDVELLYLAVRRGYRVAEVPVVWNYGEETKVDPARDSLRNLIDVLRVRLNALKKRYNLDEQPADAGEAPHAL